MKKTALFLGIIILTLGLVTSSQTSTQAAVQTPVNLPTLNAINGTPSILFDLSGMIGSNIITVVVWDAYYNLDNATVWLNGVEKLGVFTSVLYNSSVPFSLNAIADPDTNTYTVDIPTSELVEGEEHNEIAAEGGSSFGGIVYSTLGLCQTADCWGPGPLPLSVKNSQLETDPITINQADTTAPIIDFDASCLTQCGSINPIVYDYESGIEFSNFTFENELLVVYAINGEGLETFVGIDVTGIDVDCIGCVQQEECEVCTECEESTANLGIGGIILAIGILGIPIKGKTIFKRIYRKIF
ncbi:MAG: hypothetical protein GOP50_02120 [Candidatus Heimdallarchaeota archaeon]|nr:hypothetical protein [Candidatus Heimdallarchaeota archaeon]